MISHLARTRRYRADARTDYAPGMYGGSVLELGNTIGPCPAGEWTEYRAGYPAGRTLEAVCWCGWQYVTVAAADIRAGWTWPCRAGRCIDAAYREVVDRRPEYLGPLIDYLDVLLFGDDPAGWLEAADIFEAGPDGN